MGENFDKTTSNERPASEELGLQQRQQIPSLISPEISRDMVFVPEVRAEWLAGGPVGMAPEKRASYSTSPSMTSGLNFVGKRGGYTTSPSMTSGLQFIGKRVSTYSNYGSPGITTSLNGIGKRRAYQTSYPVPTQSKYAEFVNMRPFYYRQYSSPRVPDWRWSPLDSLSDAPIRPIEMSA